MTAFLQFAQPVRHHGIAGEFTIEAARGLLVEIFHDRADGGPIFGSGEKTTADRDVPLSSCLNVMSAPAVIVEIMSHGSNDTELVRDIGQFGQVFTDQQPWCAATDGEKRPSDFGGSIRFEVEGLVLARTAEQKQKDDRLGSALPYLWGLGLCCQNLGQGEPE